MNAVLGSLARRLNRIEETCLDARRQLPILLSNYLVSDNFVGWAGGGGPLTAPEFE